MALNGYILVSETWIKHTHETIVHWNVKSFGENSIFFRNILQINCRRYVPVHWTALYQTAQLLEKLCLSKQDFQIYYCIKLHNLGNGPWVSVAFLFKNKLIDFLVPPPA